MRQLIRKGDRHMWRRLKDGSGWGEGSTFGVRVVYRR